MMVGGLFDPLGTDGRPTRASASRRRPDLSALVIVSAVLVLGIVALVGTAYIRDDGDRGRPVAVSTIDRRPADSKPSVPITPITPATPAAMALDPPRGIPSAQDDQEIEIQNGVRIIRPRRGGSEPAGTVVKVPERAAQTGGIGR